MDLEAQISSTIVKSNTVTCNGFMELVKETRHSHELSMSTKATRDIVAYQQTDIAHLQSIMR